MMVKKLFSRNEKKGLEQEKTLLSLELAEIKEVADIIFERLEQKLRAAEAFEAAIDRKMAEFERLLQRAEAVRFPSTGPAVRSQEVRALAVRGMKPAEISEVLGLPVGEVELILELEVAKK